MKTDINDMMVFLAVVESGSLTAAAERLGMPKANVSRKLTRLEQQLGVTLLQRTTRTQRLTDVGKQYLDHCKRIADEIDLADTLVQDNLNEYRGSIKIGASVSVGQQLLKPILSTFLNDYPDIDVQLSLVNRRVDLVEEGFDLVVRVGPLDDSTLVAKRLSTARLCLYASPLLKVTLNDVDQLAGVPILLMSNQLSNSQITLTNGQQTKQVDVSPRMVVDDFSVVKQAIIDGVGVGLLPNYMAQRELQDGQLVSVLEQWHSEPIAINAVYPKHKTRLPRVRAFLDFLEQRMA